MCVLSEQADENELKKRMWGKSKEEKKKSAARAPKKKRQGTAQTQKRRVLTAPALPVWSPTTVLCWPYVA